MGPTFTSNNPLLLAADAAPSLLPLLQAQPELARVRDASGYTLLHALVSYNHLGFVRQVLKDFNLDVNVRDDDGESPLFVCETEEAVRCLVEELGADVTIKNHEGKTAEERIGEESEFPNVARWLRAKRMTATGGEDTQTDVEPSGDPDAEPLSFTDRPLPVPKGVSIDLSTVDEGTQEQAVDEQFRQRIESLASRPDFESERAQEELRALVTDAIRGVEPEDRGIRRRMT